MWKNFLQEFSDNNTRTFHYTSAPCTLLKLGCYGNISSVMVTLYDVVVVTLLKCSRSVRLPQVLW